MIRPDRLTIKAQEAFRDAAALAAERGNPVVNDAHLFAALLNQDEGVVQPLLQKAGRERRRAARAATERELAKFPTQQGGAEPTYSRELHRVFDRAEQEAKDLGDAYVSTEHLLIGLVEEKGTTARALLSTFELTAKELRAALEAVRGSHRVTDQTPEQSVPGAGALHPEPHRPGAQGKARSGHRAGRGGAPGDAGALPPDQEQSGADRGARRRQDRHRGRPGPADRQRRHPGIAARQGDRRAGHRTPAGGRQVPGRIRRAAQGGGEGADRGRRPLHRLHRRAAHHRRRGRGRGRRGRQQHAEARAGAGRAACRRRHHAR